MSLCRTTTDPVIMSTNEIWKHFSKEGDNVTCMKCDKSFLGSTAKRSYTSLWYHLRVKHGIEHTAANSDKPSASPKVKRQKNQSLIVSYVEKKTQSEMYSRLAAVDRLSFNQIATSSFIRDAMREKKLVAHSSPNTIRSKVSEFYQAAKEEVKQHLAKLKKGGVRFSLTFDEWSGLNCRRYMTINIHHGDSRHYNLGMIRVWGSQTAETLLKIVELRLAEFGLSVDPDVVAMVTDGASIMRKLGRLASCEHVVCLAHTIHLVVGDVLYKKKKKGSDAEEECDESADEVEDSFSGTESEEEACEESDDNGRLPDSLSDIHTDDPPELSETVEPIIKKVRVIVGKFRKSPVKNDVLQKAIKVKLGMELRVIKDCKTRWSSLCAMLERFVRISEPIDDVLEEMNLGGLILSPEEKQVVKDIISALAPFKVNNNLLLIDEPFTVNIDKSKIVF